MPIVRTSLQLVGCCIQNQPPAGLHDWGITQIQGMSTAVIWCVIYVPTCVFYVRGFCSGAERACSYADNYWQTRLWRPFTGWMESRMLVVRKNLQPYARCQRIVSLRCIQIVGNVKPCIFSPLKSRSIFAFRSYSRSRLVETGFRPAAETGIDSVSQLN